MSDTWQAIPIVFAMFVFYIFATRHARQKDVLKQLADTIREMRQDTYIVFVDSNDSQELLVLQNSTTRINIVRIGGREVLEIDLFLPDSEPEGANSTRLERTIMDDGTWSEVTYKRANKLRGRLLYYMTGSLNSAKVHAHFDEAMSAAYVHLEQNAQTAS